MKRFTVIEPQLDITIETVKITITDSLNPLSFHINKNTYTLSVHYRDENTIYSFTLFL